MPQEICVLQCFSCHVYQVDIVKKSKKWQCKMCGEKQSVFREFFRGTGAECRLHAQQLNSERGQCAEREASDFMAMMDEEEDESCLNAITQIEEEERLKALEAPCAASSGKWNAFC